MSRINRIGLDIDDVLGDHTEQFISFHHRVYRKRFRFEMFTSYGINQVLKVTPEEAYARLTEFYRSPEFEQITPTLGSQEFVQKITENGDGIFLITGRPRILKDITLSWVLKYFPEIDKKNILFSTELRPGPEQLKGQICYKRSIDLIVEDSLEQALDCAHYSGVVLFNKPWNATNVAFPKSITRVSSWNEAYNIAKKY